MGSLKIIVESILCPFSFLKPPNLFCPFPPSLFLVWKTHSFIGEPRYRRWEQQETRPSPLLGVREHRPTQRKGESEGVWEWKRQGNLRGGMSVENPWSCQLMLVHPSPHPHIPRPRCNFPLSRSFSALRSSCLLPLFSHSGFYWAQTASQADWGNIKAEASAKPRNALLSQCGKIMQSFFFFFFPYAWLWMAVYVGVSLYVIEKLWLCCFEKHFWIRTSSYINDTALSIISIHFLLKERVRKWTKCIPLYSVSLNT